jgi:predicted transcriptional regulator
MSDKDKKKETAALLKRLRAEHEETVQRTQELIKEQNALRKPIRQALKGSARTIPELAEASNLPAEQVLWHVTAMKRRGLVVETGKDGDYYRYQLAAGGTS